MKKTFNYMDKMIRDTHQHAYGREDNNRIYPFDIFSNSAYRLNKMIFRYNRRYHSKFMLDDVEIDTPFSSMNKFGEDYGR